MIEMNTFGVLSLCPLRIPLRFLWLKKNTAENAEKTQSL